MMVVDINPGLICDHPVQNVQQNDSSQLCLAYALILIVYSLLLYKYLVGFYYLYKLKLYQNIDNLDKIVITFSVLRLLNIYLYFYEGTLQITIALFLLIWDFILLIIFSKLVSESAHSLKRIWISLVLTYILYFIWTNFVNYTTLNKIMIPILIPIEFMNICIILISLSQIKNLSSKLRHLSKYARTIKIQLKNRYSFVFMMSISSLITHIFILFPETLQQAIGTTLYFLFVDWLPLLFIYLCIIRRLLKQNNQTQIQADTQISRNSYLIQVQLNDIYTK